MTISRSKRKRKDKNSLSIRKGFIDSLLPDPNSSKEDKKKFPYNWGKYLKLAIAVIRMAEYDYLSIKNSSDDDWKSAKIFLFGRNTLFSCVCHLMKINENMARLKLVAYKKAGKVGDPIFGCMSNDDSVDDIINNKTSLSTTSKEIEKILEEE